MQLGKLSRKVKLFLLVFGLIILLFLLLTGRLLKKDKQIGDKKPVANEELLILGTSESIDGLEKHQIYTDKGVYECAEEIDVTLYLYQSVQAVTEENRILHINNLLQREVRLENCLIIENTSDEVTVFSEGFRISLPCKNLSTIFENEIVDIYLTNGSITKISTKKESIMGKILSIRKEGLEIEGYGVVPLSEKFRFYEINGYVYISPYYTNRLVDIDSSDKSTIQLYGTELSDARAFTLTKKDNSIKTELVIKDGSTLSKDGTDLMGVALGKNAKDVISQFDNENLSIYDFEGNALESSATVGTGCIVKLTVNGKVVDSLTVIVKGDVTGEGTIDATDYLRIKGEFIGTYKLEDAFAKAADVDGNENIDGTDYLRIKSIFLGGNLI